MEKKGVVDRFEGKYAVVEIEGVSNLTLPSRYLLK
ncbi:Protein of unknown function (DUF3006) [Brevibacillus sp. BC25]|nr:Protein of unknown function (DUF3006) [Brevibacillus sp. BC25]